jgi:hypothetical protein
MIARILANSDSLPPFNSKRIELYCSRIDEIMMDDSRSLAIFQEAIRVFDAAGLDISDKQFKSEADTAAVLSHLRSLGHPV